MGNFHSVAEVPQAGVPDIAGPGYAEQGCEEKGGLSVHSEIIIENVAMDENSTPIPGTVP